MARSRAPEGAHVSEPLHFSDGDLDALAERVATKILGVLRPVEPEPTASALLLTKGELAHALRRSTPTIDRWATEGMPFVDMGTYRLYDLAVCQPWIAGRRKPGRPLKAGPVTAASPPATVPRVELRTRLRRTCG
jgi:hypothetical protein